MSYILEALRKAERERALGRAPDLNAVAIAPTPPRRSIWPWLTGFVVVVVNAAILIVVLDQRWRAEPAPETAFAPKPATAQPAPTPHPMPAPQPKPESLATTAPKPAAAARPPAPIRSPEAPPKAPAASAPLLQSLPAEFRRNLPELNLDIHVYNQKPEKRFVLINSRRYREGDSLQEGPRLETITLDGAVFSHRGRRFRILVHH